MNPISPTQETLDLVKASQGRPMDLAKAGITVATGLVGFSLEAPSKLLYPVLTPLRNIIPRAGSSATGGTAENWKVVLGINTANVRIGVSEGHRNAAISYTTANRLAAYVGLGLEDTVSFEAQYAGMGFEDARSLAALTLLQATMLGEEEIILNGNQTLQLGVTPTPTLTTATTGGTIANGTTNFVYCVALTHTAFQNLGGVQNPVPSTAVLVPIVTRPNVDGSTDVFGGGFAQISAASSAITTTGSGTSTITATVTPVKGAFGYAWFFGITAGAGNAQLVAITALPNAVITAVSTATYPANSTGLSADNSTCGLEFDGLIVQCLKGNGYYKSMAGLTLNADGVGGVTEIEAAFKYFWDTYRLSPDTIWMDSQTIRDVTKKVAGGTNPGFRVNVTNDVSGLGNLTMGSLVTSVINKYALNGAQSVDVKIHPNMPVGTMFFDLKSNPYPNSRVPVPRRIRTRQEYYQIEWPVRTRQYELGVYVDEMLQCYMPFGTGVITDIAAG